MKIALVRITLFALIGSVPAILSAQAVPAVGHSGRGVADGWSPWEASVSANWTRANFPVLSDSLNVVGGGASNTQAVKANLIAMPSSPATSSVINIFGTDFALQQNFKSWLGFQIDSTGGVGARNVVNTANVTVYKFSPKYLAFTYGPVLTLRRAHRTNLWVRGLLGVARQDACPDTSLKTAVRAIIPTYRFADSAIAGQGGVGIDRAITSRVHLRIALDDIHTTLFNSSQDQVRGTVGFAWGWGSDGRN